jgi:hypothetical protein
MNMRHYLTLHLSVMLGSLSCSFTSISLLSNTLKTQIRLESKDRDVNEHERLPNITLKTQIRLESKDIDVNEHERLPNITLKTQIRLESVVSHVHLHLYPYFLI